MTLPESEKGNNDVTCTTCPPIGTVEYNGVEMRISDVPDKFSRWMLGYGHENPWGRPVIPGDWPHTVDTCRFEEHPARWQDNEGNWLTLDEAKLCGHTLVCTGCGLDCT